MTEPTTGPVRPQPQVELPFPVPRRVGIGAPFRWLQSGVRDLLRAPGPSLFYGTVFSFAGWLI